MFLQVSPELARIMAYVFADGCVSKSESVGCYQVSFSNTNMKYVEDFISCIKVVLPDVNYYVSLPTEKCTTPCTTVTIANAVVWEFFSNFKKGAADITIPQFILNGHEDVKYNFIGAAIDCNASRRKSYTSSADDRVLTT